LIVAILLTALASSAAAQSQSAVVADLKAKFKEGYGTLDVKAVGKQLRVTLNARSVASLAFWYSPASMTS
jgi:hypothetical protein